ncbi:WD40-repeat-containing domain protein [Baffinella frigidus]|nr:WD40-repeat-containing domain protein [Cryptophyta sp. CCMP2293]
METPSKDKAPRKPNKTSVLLKGHAQLVTGVALSPSEVNHVASSCADGQLKIWDISSGVCLRTLCENDKRLSCVSYSKDGSRLITGDWAYTTRVWDIGSSSVVVNLNGHAGKITAARYRPDGMFLLTSSEDKSMRAWDMRKGASVLDCRWSADGQKVIAACKDASILIFDARIPTTPFQATSSGKPYFSPRIGSKNYFTVLKGHSEWVTCVDVSEDGTQILSGSVDRTLKDAVNSCKFIDKFIVSGSGNRFWGSKDNRVLMWEIEEGKGHMRRSMLGHNDCL